MGGDHIQRLTQVLTVRLKESLIRSGYTTETSVTDVLVYADDPVCKLETADGKKLLAWIVGWDLMLQEFLFERSAFGYTLILTSGKAWKIDRTEMGWVKTFVTSRSFPIVVRTAWASERCSRGYNRRASGTDYVLQSGHTRWKAIKSYCGKKFNKPWRVEYVINPSVSPGHQCFYMRVIGDESDLDKIAYAESLGELV